MAIMCLTQIMASSLVNKSGYVELNKNMIMLLIFESGINIDTHKLNSNPKIPNLLCPLYYSITEALCQTVIVHIVYPPTHTVHATLPTQRDNVDQRTQRQRHH